MEEFNTLVYKDSLQPVAQSAPLHVLPNNDADGAVLCVESLFFLADAGIYILWPEAHDQGPEMVVSQTEPYKLALTDLAVLVFVHLRENCLGELL